MAISVGDAILKLGCDTTGFDQSLKQTETKTKTAFEKMQKHMLPVGAALTAVGAAGLKMVDSAKKMNAQLSVTAVSMGITTKEMRNLALETTNVTFPLEEVTASFDFLARAGIRDQQVLKDTATAFDTLGDAIGMPASLVTEVMVPAMKTFGLSAEEIASKTDMMTYMVRNSTISLEDLNTMVGYTDQEMVAAGFSIDDMAAAMIYMSDNGVEPGKVMLREWNKAVTRSKEEGISMTEALGMTNEELETYKGKLEGAAGLTQELADLQNEQYGIIANLKHEWSKLTLAAGSFLEPLEPILAGMTAMGPAMMFMSTSMGAATVKTLTHTVALVAHKVAMIASAIAVKAVTAAQWLWNAAMSANPIGLIILAIAAVIAAIVLLVKNWDWVKAQAEILWDKLKEVWENISNFFKSIPDEFKRRWEIFTSFLKSLNPWKHMEAAWKKLTENASDVFSKISEPVEKWWNIFTHWLKYTLMPWLFLVEHWEEVTEFGTAVFTNISDRVKKWWNTFIDFLKKLNPWNAMKAGWEKITDGVMGIFGKLFGSGEIDKWFGDLKSWFGRQSFDAETSQAFGTILTAAEIELAATGQLTKETFDEIRAYLEGLVLPYPDIEPPPPIPPPTPTPPGPTPPGPTPPGPTPPTPPEPTPGPETGPGEWCKGNDLWYWSKETGWVMIQANSPKCMEEEWHELGPPTPTPPTPPTPPPPEPMPPEDYAFTLGPHYCKCIGTDLYQWVTAGQRWELWIKDARECGGEAPPYDERIQYGWWGLDGRTGVLRDDIGCRRYRVIPSDGGWQRISEDRPFEECASRIELPTWNPKERRWFYQSPVDPSKIYPLAQGGIITRPTLAKLGEAGPEMVIPLRRQTALSALNALGSITNNFNIAELVVREEADISRIASELYSIQRRKMRMAGI